MPSRSCDKSPDVHLVIDRAKMVTALTALRRRRSGKSDGPDALTGLPGWPELERRGREELARARQETSACSVLVIDVDAMDSFGRTFGEPAAEAALRLISRAIALSCRRADLAVRLGKTEFALLAAGTPATAAALLGQRIQGMLDRLAREPSVATAPLSVSVGVADLERAPPSVGEMVETARQALRHARSVRPGAVALAPRRGEGPQATPAAGQTATG